MIHNPTSGSPFVEQRNAKLEARWLGNGSRFQRGTMRPGRIQEEEVCTSSDRTLISLLGSRGWLVVASSIVVARPASVLDNFQFCKDSIRLPPDGSHLTCREVRKIDLLSHALELEDSIYIEHVEVVPSR